MPPPCSVMKSGRSCYEGEERPSRSGRVNSAWATSGRTAICATPRSFPNHMVEPRRRHEVFIEDWRSLRGRIQLDRRPQALPGGGRGCVRLRDRLRHDHQALRQPAGGTEKRYSPLRNACGTTKTVVTGKPDRKHISTSYVGAPEPDHAEWDAPVHPPNETDSARRATASGDSLL